MKHHNSEMNIKFLGLDDDYIKDNLKLRQKGIWVKYNAEPKNWSNKNASYNKLHNDLKDSDKDWPIAKNIDECEKELCGEMIPSEGTKPGDIYVFYEEIEQRRVPIFYIKLCEFKDSSTKEVLNYIEFNSNSIGFDEISGKYLSELILKLIEIDETKNKKYINELKERYIEYDILTSFIDNKTLEEDELNFIYYMAFIRKETIAIDKIKNRDLKNDFENFSDSQKARLYFNIKDTEIVNQLTIDSKKVLMEITKYGCIKQLTNATKEIIEDKKFIIKLLNCYFEGLKNKGSLVQAIQIIKYLPPKYKDDIDILTLIMNYNTSLGIGYALWFNEKHNDNEFVYKLISLYVNTFIKKGKEYNEHSMEYLLSLFSNEVLNDIEYHILIGPESNIIQEELKNNIIDKLIKSKCKILNYRQKN